MSPKHTSFKKNMCKKIRRTHTSQTLQTPSTKLMDSSYPQGFSACESHLETPASSNSNSKEEPASGVATWLTEVGSVSEGFRSAKSWKSLWLWLYALEETNLLCFLKNLDVVLTVSTSLFQLWLGAQHGQAKQYHQTWRHAYDLLPAGKPPTNDGNAPSVVTFHIIRTPKKTKQLSAAPGKICKFSNSCSKMSMGAYSGCWPVLKWTLGFEVVLRW